MSCPYKTIMNEIIGHYHEGEKMSKNAITATNLVYQYGDLTAVDGISFEVAEGEVLGFLGPNGAGKTTTVKMLTGQLKPKSGQATLLGLDIVKNARKVKSQIGVSFEIPNMYEQMSAEENLKLFANLYGVKNFDARPLLEKVGLGGREGERVEGYSKGMKQRLMVARALVSKPKILFLDEPTEGLDPVSSESIRNLILEQANNGTTIFLTTHDMMEADKISNRVAFINQGKIVALDTPHELKQQFGKRALKAEVKVNGKLETRELTLDEENTSAAIKELFEKEEVVTVHSEEATLEDIFIKITGRGLV
jgi:ABC-2 type transport system ATP-binding protein